MKKLIIAFLAVVLVVQAGAFTVFAESQEEDDPTITISNIDELQLAGEDEQTPIKLEAEGLPSEKLEVVSREVTEEGDYIISGQDIEIAGGRYSFKLVIRANGTLTFDNDLEIYYQGINGKYKLYYEIDEKDAHIMTVTGTFEKIIISSPIMEKLSDRLREKILSRISDDTYLYELFLKTDEGFTFKNMLSYLVDGKKRGYSIDFEYDKAAGRQSIVVTEIKDNAQDEEEGEKPEDKDQDAIKKAKNPLQVKGSTATVKYSKLKKKSQTLKAAKVFRFIKKGQGKMSYVKKSGNKKITINKKTGKVTIKKGLKKKTYKVVVKVRAAGNAKYEASTWKKVTVKIRVK